MARASAVVDATGGFAEVFPEDKCQVVKALQSTRHVVGMTGDGVNDAPALRQAEVSIAVSGATDVAKGAASVVLTEEGLGCIVDLVKNAVVVVTVLCLVSDRTAAIHEAARVLRSGGRLVIGELGRWNAWAAKRRVRGWFGSPFWRAAHFSTASELCGLVESVGLTVEAVRGSVFYPPLGILARSMAPVDKWIGSTTTIGAAFIAIAATKQAVRRTL